jgi:Cd(II)/Pb(II)-responsive transcriptional regulator
MLDYRIGELAAAAGCQVETIRYYEREGLLPAPARSGGNYRLYRAEHLDRLAFIRRCRSIDMSLAEVRHLLHFKDVPDENCGEVNRLLDVHIERLGQRLAELKALEAHMVALRADCRQSLAARDCGILKGLSQPHA